MQEVPGSSPGATTLLRRLLTASPPRRIVALVRTWTRIALALFVAALVASSRPRPSAYAEMPAASAAEFNTRVAEYVTVHRRAAATLRMQRQTADGAGITERQKALADRIRAVRLDARQGQIFTAPVEADLRRITRVDLSARDPADRAAVRKEVPRLAFRVNDEYPTDAPLATVPPMLLAILPRLPEELEYRFFDRHLILLDVDANLIVDYIPDALPPAPR